MCKILKFARNFGAACPARSLAQSAVPVWGTLNSCDAEYHQQAEILRNLTQRTINLEKNVYKLSRRRFNKRTNDDAQRR